MDPLERRHDQAGVAICYNKNIANLVDKLPDGGNRVAAISINAEKPIVIIWNVMYFSTIPTLSTK
jgi:hypothetical protein